VLTVLSHSFLHLSLLNDAEIARIFRHQGFLMTAILIFLDADGLIGYWTNKAGLVTSVQ
jgi:hypothetical protein